MSSSLTTIEPIEAIVGHWYRRLDDGQTFCVTGVNETHGFVEARLASGEVEEIEAGSWLGMNLEYASGPEDRTPARDSGNLAPPLLS